MKMGMLFGSAARVALAAGLIGCAQVAVAQQAASSATASAPADDDRLADIIVNARKMKERLQDAPVAVTTVNADVLQERGIRDISELTKLAPSLNISTDGDVRISTSIRGIGGSSDTNAAPGVGLFVDGVYQPASAYYSIPFFDVQRIEILKGPQGTLYGKNTEGGAISIYSRDPGDHLSTNFSVEGSTGPQIVANAAISIPIDGEAFGNRTSIFYRYSEGLQRNKTTGEDAAMRRDYAIRSRFVFKPSDNYHGALSFYIAELHSNPFPESTTNLGLNTPIDNVTKDYNGFIDSRYKSVNLTQSLELGGATLSALTSYDNGHVVSNVDGDYTAANALVSGGTSDRDTFAQELRLASSDKVSSNLHWLLGAYYNDDRVSLSSLTTVNFPGFGVIPQSSGPRHEVGKTYAGFGQATLLVDKFEIAAGLRYDDEKRHGVSNISSISFLTFRYTTTPFDATVTSRAWQPKLSLSYHFTPDVMAYGLVSRGFRAGGFNDVTAPPTNQSYQPEHTTNFEAGLKTELFDRKVRLNTTLFYTRYSDIQQAAIYAATNTVYTANGGSAKSYGVELEAAWRVSKALTLSGAYTYLNLKNDVIPLQQIRREVSGFAPHTFNVSADYVQPIGRDLSFGAHASVNYIGKTPLGTEVVWRDAHALTDASVDITWQGVTFAAFGKNIFNQHYYTSYIPRTSTALQTSALGVLNRSAEFGFRMSGNF